MRLKDAAEIPRCDQIYGLNKIKKLKKLRYLKYNKSDFHVSYFKHL